MPIVIYQAVVSFCPLQDQGNGMDNEKRCQHSGASAIDRVW